MNQQASLTSGPRRTFLATLSAAAVSLFARKGEAQPQSPSRSLAIGRRIVTGVDAQGRSLVASEEPVPPNSTWQAGGNAGLIFSVVREVPAPLNGPVEPTPEYNPAARAPDRGLDGRLFTWQPGYSYRSHSTPTLDFVIILAGSLELLLDTDSRILSPGDVVVQRGTRHGWRVVGTEPCTFAAIFIDAKASS